LEDAGYREDKEAEQQQMEFEIRQSIEGARQAWKEKKGRPKDDDDDYDVEVEYVRE